MKDVISEFEISTVCQSARCPNIYDCFSRRRCTFMLLGDICTRGCKFCSVQTKKGDLSQPDRDEILNIQHAVKRLDICEVMITSVTRDDLPDGGAGHFADCINTLKNDKSDLHIEVLVPDFQGKKSSIEKVVLAMPDVFGHNVETIPRLYKEVRPQADYKRSLFLLREAKRLCPGLIVKSGLMVGLGEKKNEVYEVMKDLREYGCDVITIGQYLKPDPLCLEVREFIHPDDFLDYSRRAKELGFIRALCSPFARSSYEPSFSSLEFQ